MRASIAFAVLLLPTGGAAAARTTEAGRPPVVEIGFEGNVKDATRGYRGRMEGDDIEFQQGMKGQALFIGGTEDWASVAIGDKVGLSKGFTAEMWFRRENWENPYKGGSGWQTVVAFDGFTVNITAPGCPSHDPWAIEARVGKRLAERDVLVSTAGNSIQPEIWYHLALVYDAKAGATQLYLDAELVMDETETAPELELKTAADAELRFGTWFKANQAFRGSVDEFRLYDYPRSPADVRASAKRPKPQR